MVTNYRYNTLNQVIQSYQPDYDSVSYVYYDILSRPVLSQDGKQRQGRKYSYTVYDDLGRIVEVGQVKNSTPVSRNDAANPTFVTQFLNNGTKSEITKTWYDEPMSPSLNLNQTHLRNRIAAVSFALADDNNYQSATHYSYDIHGNVKRLIQDIPALSSFGRRFTSLDYEYDLISGNVNRVWYQKGKLEQFSHRYRYDADNRVTHVYTTNIFKVKRDSVVSQERLEARYFYLPTGALSRAELGHKQIQGIDYAYTLQGWLKDINGYRSSGTDMYDSYDSYDIGNDGVIQTDNVNRLFAHDGYASSNQYYQGDYTPVSGNNYFNELSYDAIPLYNGNISALSESVYNLGEKGFLKLFRYDKLNRIKRMRTAAHHQNNPGWETASDNFATDYSYDWNGNLLFLHRKKQSGQEMHNIRYTYPNDNNRLGAITSTGIASSAYQYDALGNLVRDNAEGLTVGWNAMGKVDTIHRNGSLLSSFRYSPTGQRQVKTDSSGVTFYIHDATGNVMCIYRQDGDTLRATERYLYGSKRLGMLEQQIWITANSIGLQDSNTIGVRVYEFTDHLGNVTYTAQDRKHLVQDNYGQWQYIPSAVSYTDYYPFGYPMPGRSSAMGGYRYFFNGQETDNEVLGDGALHAFEYRMHDTRLGRFWSVDPLAGDYPYWSTYQFAGLMPTWYGELEGLEPVARPLRYTPNTRIQLGRNRNNYARTGEYVRLPSFRQTTTYTYRVGPPTGYRPTVPTPLAQYIFNYHSPQGNNISMTRDDVQAQIATLFGDWCQIYTQRIEDKLNTPSGFRVVYKTQVKFSDYRLQYKFDLMQLEYENQFQRLFNELPDSEIESPSYMPSYLQQLWRDAEKTRRVRDVLGPSPQDYLDRIILFNMEKPFKVEIKTEDIPEIKPAE